MAGKDWRHESGPHGPPIFYGSPEDLKTDFTHGIVDTCLAVEGLDANCIAPIEMVHLEFETEKVQQAVD